MPEPVAFGAHDTLSDQEIRSLVVQEDSLGQGTCESEKVWRESAGSTARRVWLLVGHRLTREITYWNAPHNAWCQLAGFFC
jgi:hypothetical protein